MSLFSTMRGLWRVQSLGPLFGGRKRKSRKKHGKSRKKTGVNQDLFSALRNLGYSANEARQRAARATGKTFDELFRSAMR